MVLYSNESEHFFLSNFLAIFVFSILSQIVGTPTVGGASKILKNFFIQISHHLRQFGTLFVFSIWSQICWAPFMGGGGGV